MTAGLMNLQYSSSTRLKAIGLRQSLLGPQLKNQKEFYATLSQEHQRVIGGMIALPDLLQTDAARTVPSSLTKPLDRISPVRWLPRSRSNQPGQQGRLHHRFASVASSVARSRSQLFDKVQFARGTRSPWSRLDLTISTIEVRGPSPIYHPDYETEDYLLDGIDLIALDSEGNDIPPLYKGGPILPRSHEPKEMRVFRLRNNSSGLIVRRHGGAPGNYFWEVWDPNSHVTKLYGGELNAQDSKFEFDRGNGVLRETITSGGDARDVIGQWNSYTGV